MPGSENIADVFTKALGRLKLKYLVARLFGLAVEKLPNGSLRAGVAASSKYDPVVADRNNPFAHPVATVGESIHDEKTLRGRGCAKFTGQDEADNDETDWERVNMEEDDKHDFDERIRAPARKTPGMWRHTRFVEPGLTSKAEPVGPPSGMSTIEQGWVDACLWPHQWRSEDGKPNGSRHDAGQRCRFPA